MPERIEHKTASLGHLAHVGLHSNGCSPFGLNACDDVLSLLCVFGVIHDNERSTFCESLRNGPSDATGGAGDDGDFSTQ